MLKLAADFCLPVIGSTTAEACTIDCIPSIWPRNHQTKKTQEPPTDDLQKIYLPLFINQFSGLSIFNLSATVLGVKKVKHTSPVSNWFQSQFPAVSSHRPCHVINYVSYDHIMWPNMVAVSSASVTSSGRLDTASRLSYLYQAGIITFWWRWNTGESDRDHQKGVTKGYNNNNVYNFTTNKYTTFKIFWNYHIQ